MTVESSIEVYTKRQVHVMFGALLLLVVILASFVIVRTTSLRAELAARPPVAVLRVDTEILDALSKSTGVGNAGAVDAEIARVREAGTKLARSGYLVLDAKTVYAFPADFEVELP